MKPTGSFLFPPVLLILTIGLFSCIQTPPLSPPIAAKSQLTGEWEWFQTTGGIAGVYMTPETEGYTQRVVFTASKEMYWYRNDTLLAKYSYNVRRGHTPYFRDAQAILILSGSVFDLVYWFSGKDTLYLAENVYDGFIYAFERDTTGSPAAASEEKLAL